MAPQDESSEQAELEALEAQIRHHEERYRAGEPEIVDSDFDALTDRYHALADSLGIAEAARVGAAPGDDHTAGFETVDHRVPMLSLEKLSPNRRDSHGEPLPIADQLSAWHKRRLKELDVETLSLVVEPKIDGISASITYVNGVLDQAVTRGDGRRGDVITKQVAQLGTVPTKLKGLRKGSFEVRGELYWPRAAFEAFNQTLDKPLINPRNGCAGMMKRKDPTDLGTTGIRAFFYQVAWSENLKLPPRQSDVLAWLRDRGAEVYLDEVRVVNDDVDALAYCDGYAERKAELGYDIDGMVIKVDELRHYDNLGATGHHPHWGIAYKFAPERKPTKLLEIHVQVGKSGKLTPVAILEPVFVSNTTVSRASLHNFVELERKDVRVSDTVMVEKAGEIIPQVVEIDRTMRKKGARKFKRPSACPTCGTPVVTEEIFIYCPNPVCPDQVRERLRHFASRRAMDMDGLGSVLVDQIVDQFGVRAPHEIFLLTAEQLAGLERMGDKSAQRVIQGLDAAKTRGLARVLNGLAVRHVGETMAEDLASYFGSADKLLAFAARYHAGDDEAVELVAPSKSSERGAIEGLARKSADSIFADLNSEPIRAVFEGLREAGVSLDSMTTAVSEVTGVAGKSFVLTGTLPTLKRSDAASRIKAAGGKVSGSVSKKTDFLVAGADAGSKLDKATTLGITLLNEAELLAMLAV